MAKFVQLEAFGADMNMRIVADQPIPEPKAGEVLIQIYLRPVNPTDVLFCQGAYGTFPVPRVPGSEGVAKVLKNGEGCSKFKEGQRVVAVQWPQFTQGGSWTTHASLPESILFAVPDGLSDEKACQFFINPCTVYGMLKTAAVPEGEFLLHSAAGSVLGKMMIALCKHWGVKLINVVRRSDAVQELKDLGAEYVIATDKEDVTEKVKEITGGKGAHACLDPVAGPGSAKLIAGLKNGGKYYAYGALDQSGNSQFSAMDLLNGKVLSGFLIYGWIEQPEKEQVVKEVFQLMEDGVLSPHEGETFKLDDFQAAIKKSNEVARGGKVFLCSRA